MTHRIQFLLGLAVIAWALVPVTAQESTAGGLKLHYRELTDRQVLKFRMNGAEQSAPIGRLNWDFPSVTFATVGLDPQLSTFCLEPLVPVVAGNDYAFDLEPFGTTKDFNLKEDEAGKKEAERRAKYVRELYGRAYADLLKDPAAVAPAFNSRSGKSSMRGKSPTAPSPST